MLLYFNRAPFILAHCLIDDICLPVLENINILIIVLMCLCIYFYIFLNSFSVFFWRTTLETSVLLCALMCILGKYYIYIYHSLSAVAQG